MFSRLSQLRHFRDNWFNYVHYFEVVEPHTDSTIESQVDDQHHQPLRGGQTVRRTVSTHSNAAG